jgi:dihydropteridine reductase
MMGYGMSKAAAHHIVQTMGATTGKSLESTTAQKAGRKHRQYAANLDTLSVIGILPTTLDTPSNRRHMPNADYTTWTKPLHIAKEIGNWVKMPQLRPHSGALVKVSTNAQGSTFDLVR